MAHTVEPATPDSVDKPTVLVTGVSGNLGLRLMDFAADLKIIGVDVKPPHSSRTLAHFEEIDLAQERSCSQLLELMRAYRPEAVVHLAFIVDPLRAGVVDRDKMWHINVAGS